MKTLIAVLVLLFAVSAEARTKAEVIDSLRTSGDYVDVGDPVLKDMPEYGFADTTKVYHVTTAEDIDSLTVKLTRRVLLVFHEGTGDEQARFVSVEPFTKIPKRQREIAAYLDSAWVRLQYGDRTQGWVVVERLAADGDSVLVTLTHVRYHGPGDSLQYRKVVSVQ